MYPKVNYPISFKTSVPSYGIVKIERVFDKTVRPMCLAIPSKYAARFRVADLFVDGKSQFPAGPVPAEMYQHDLTQTHFFLSDVAPASTPIVLVVENMTDIPHVLFEGVLVCEVTDEDVSGILIAKGLAVKSFLSFSGTYSNSESLVLPGSTMHLVTMPQVVFKPHRLAVSPECAPHFDVLDLRVGYSSIFLNTSPMAASLFPAFPDDSNEVETAAQESLRLGMRTVQVAQEVSISVRNNSNEPRAFRAALWGHHFFY